MTIDQQPIVRVEDSEPGRKVFSIEVPEEILAPEIEKEFRRLAGTVRVPGFRKGKVPRSILEGRFAETARSEAIERIVSRFVWETLKENDIVPFFDPEIDRLTAPAGGPIAFRLSVDPWPKVEMKKYRDLILVLSLVILPFLLMSCSS